MYVDPASSAGLLLRVAGIGTMLLLLLRGRTLAQTGIALMVPTP